MQKYRRGIFKIFRLFIAFGTILILSHCNLGNDQNHIQELEAKAAMDKIQDGSITILDVRTPGEYKEVRIPESRNINYNSDTFRSAIRTLPKEQGYLLYCGSGRRSYMAAKRMESMGYKDVWHLKDGIEAWENAGLPLDKPE